MYKLFLLISVCFISQLVWSQDSITVHKDPRIDILNSKRIAINKIAAKMTSSGKFRGYRIQVINTRSREEAFQIKSQLLQRFGDQTSYVLYQSPYFKVRIGNFINKEDAEKFKKSMLPYFPQGVFVIEDLIDYYPTSTDMEETGN